MVVPPSTRGSPSDHGTGSARPAKWRPHEAPCNFFGGGGGGGRRAPPAIPAPSPVFFLLCTARAEQHWMRIPVTGPPWALNGHHGSGSPHVSPGNVWRLLMCVIVSAGPSTNGSLLPTQRPAPSSEEIRARGYKENGSMGGASDRATPRPRGGDRNDTRNGLRRRRPLDRLPTQAISSMPSSVRWRRTCQPCRWTERCFDVPGTCFARTDKSLAAISLARGGHPHPSGSVHESCRRRTL